MASRRRGWAASRYRGLRITVTQDVESPTAWVTVAGKRLDDRWDEWALVLPSIRIEEFDVETVDGAASRLARALVEEVVPLLQER